MSSRLLVRLFTLPAYLVRFGVLWGFIRRFRFPFWHYRLPAGLGQTLGDGGLHYFLGSPAMPFFLPYPMSNDHAVNVPPFLAVRDRLPSGRPLSARVRLVVPALVATSFVCGALIRWFGQRLGLSQGTDGGAANAGSGPASGHEGRAPVHRIRVRGASAGIFESSIACTSFSSPVLRSASAATGSPAGRSFATRPQVLPQAARHASTASREASDVERRPAWRRGARAGSRASPGRRHVL